MTNPQQTNQKSEKKWLLLLIAGVCIYLYFQGSEHIPYRQYFGDVAGGIHAFNFLTNLTK